MLEVNVYTRDGCGICTKVKQKLGLYLVPFTEHKIGVDITREELLRKFPNQTSLPIVECEWGVFGGQEADKLITEYKYDFGKELLID